MIPLEASAPDLEGGRSARQDIWRRYIPLMAFWRDWAADCHWGLARVFLLLRRYEAAAQSYARALRIRPDDPHLQFMRAWCLLEVRARAGEGIAAFLQLMQQSPSSGGYFLLACGLQRESRHEEAVEAFREAERLDDCRTPDFFHNYAVSLQAVRRFEEAVDAWRRAAQLDPSNAEAWGNLGSLLVVMGRWRDAAPCLERAMRLAPSVARALDLAAAFYEVNRMAEAERVLRDALSLDPGSSEVREMLATVLAAQDRFDEALEVAREACDITRGAQSSRTVLALVLAEAGMLEEALQVAKDAVRDAPQDARTHFALGQIYLKMRDGEAALSAFENMARCFAPEPESDRLPSSPWISYAAGRGTALSLLGRHTEAMAAFDEVLRNDPTFFERWPELASHYEASSGQAGRGEQQAP